MTPNFAGNQLMSMHGATHSSENETQAPARLSGQKRATKLANAGVRCFSTNPRNPTCCFRAATTPRAVAAKKRNAIERSSQSASNVYLDDYPEITRDRQHSQFSETPLPQYLRHKKLAVYFCCQSRRTILSQMIIPTLTGSDLTTLLRSWREGSGTAFASVIDQVYAELKNLCVG